MYRNQKSQSSINIEFYIVNDDTSKIDENKISILFIKTHIFSAWAVFLN